MTVDPSTVEAALAGAAATSGMASVLLLAKSVDVSRKAKADREAAEKRLRDLRSRDGG